jgi:nitrogen fixation NifU-like protein
MNDTSDTHAKDVDTTLIVRAPAHLTLVLAISANARNAGIKTIILSREIIKYMAYSDKVIDHYENPRNVGKFETDDTIGTGMVGAPACGDVMKLQIKVEDGIIRDARFKTYGCGSAIASSSLVTEWVKGKTLDEAFTIKNSAIAEELALPPVKIHCSILAEDAIKAAVLDYKKKHDLVN